MMNTKKQLKKLNKDLEQNLKNFENSLISHRKIHLRKQDLFRGIITFCNLNLNYFGEGWATKNDLITCKNCLKNKIDILNNELDKLPRIIDEHVAEYAVNITKEIEECVKQLNEIK